MTYQEAHLSTIQGIDTEDFLEHIAWKDLIKPRLLEAKAMLTQRLVASVLNDDSAREAEGKERIAGKIFGIDFVIREIEKFVTDGRKARSLLAQNNIHIEEARPD